MSRNHVTLVSLAVLILTASIVAAQEPEGSPVFEQQLLAGDPGDNAWFGENLAMEGDTIVVGARQEDLGTEPDEQNVGAVYVYTRTGGVWTMAQKITPDPAFWEYGLSYGCSVDIDGDTLVIGAYHWDSYKGFAEVYVRTGGVWAFQQRLNGDMTVNSWFGFSSAIDGDSVIVGEFNATGAGAAYVFTRSGTVWTRQQKIAAPVPDPNNRFGIRVDIEGDTVVVGDDQTDLSQAHVFIRDMGTWSLQQTLTPSDLNAEKFGFTLALDGESVLIGDRMADVDTVVDAGAAYVFTRTGVLWSEQQRLTASDPQQEAHFGRGLGIEGDTAVVAASHRDLDSMIDAGAAAVFRKTNGVWTQVGALVASDPLTDAKFGISAAMSGGTAVIGGYHYDHGGFDEAGAADVFLVSNIFVFADGFEDGTTDGWDSAIP